MPSVVSILLVEDDDVIRRTLGMASSRYGHAVSTAEDGLTGLEMFRRESPEIAHPQRKPHPRRHGPVDRTAFYGTRPDAHLRVEFEHRLRAMQQAGVIPDPRDAQILRFKVGNRA